MSEPKGENHWISKMIHLILLATVMFLGYWVIKIDKNIQETKRKTVPTVKQLEQEAGEAEWWINRRNRDRSSESILRKKSPF